ncbi:Tar ligand binding domain-containing protein [Variovorax durovernensis]
MKFLAKLGIATRLYCVLAILVASLTWLASVSWRELSRVSDLAAATEDLRVPQLQRIAAIELNVIRASLQIRHAMLVKSPRIFKPHWLISRKGAGSFRKALRTFARA